MLTVKIGSQTLACVKEVARSSEYARDVFVAADGEGAPSNTWEVIGYISAAPDPFTEQVTLENALAGEGDCTISIEDHGGNVLATFTGRVRGISWAPYHTGPLSFYTISVESESQANPFAGTVILNTTTLNDPTPAVTEQYRSGSPDDGMDKIHNRQFRITGRKTGDFSAQHTFHQTLENALTSGAGADGYFTFTSPMGTYDARATSFEITRPDETDIQGGITYTIDLETRPDYSLESFGLPHTQVNIGGLTWDVVNSLSHNIERVQKGTTAFYRISSESMSWSLKKYFTVFSQVENFKTQIDALVNNRVTMSSPIGTTLECKSVSYNVPAIDGHEAGTDLKRYSISASLTFSKPTSARDNPGGSAFGIIFETITSDGRGVTIDENGGITNRNRNVSGKVSSLPAPSIIGTSVIESDGTYYITGLNIGRLDNDGFWEISVSGRTLDSESQCHNFIDEIFGGVHFNDVKSKSKSVSRSQQLDTNTLEVTGVSESISGDVWGVDAQSLLNLVSTFASTYGIATITSMNVGNQQPWTHPVTGACTFRQSVSLTRNTQFRPTEEPDTGGEEEEEAPSFDPQQPDVKEDEGFTISEQTDRYTPITIPGGKIVFKKTGINPMKATAYTQRTAKNHGIFKSMGDPPDPSQPPGLAAPQPEKDERSEQGLTIRKTKGWISTDSV